MYHAPALRFPLTAAILCLLVACGGGGGGGSSSNTPSPSGLQLTVKVNNEIVAPVGNVVTLGNGDTVTVEADRSVMWQASTPGALVTNSAIAPQSWTARLAKQTTAAAVYTLQATSGTDMRSVIFNIAQGDVRNGDYKLFSANASEYTLRVDFDLRQYSVRSGNTAVSSGAFSDAVDGTYTFTVPGYAPLRNNARFRTAGGIIVGAHPVGGAEAQPFVAANHFVTAAADLPLTNLWMFSSDVMPASVPVVNSRIMSVRLVASQITYCSVPAGAITTVAACAPANLSTNPLTFNPDRSITWDDAGSPVALHVVRTDSELILVRAQSYGTGNKRFQIALDDTKAITSGDYEGGISNGSWGTTSVSATAFNQSALTSAGVPDNVTGALGSAGAAAVPLRNVFVGSDGVSYFVQSTGVMEAHIAARGSAKAGRVGLGLRR
jgi:hypothetical protein